MSGAVGDPRDPDMDAWDADQAEHIRNRLDPEHPDYDDALVRQLYYG